MPCPLPIYLGVLDAVCFELMPAVLFPGSGQINSPSGNAVVDVFLGAGMRPIYRRSVARLECFLALVHSEPPVTFHTSRTNPQYEGANGYHSIKRHNNTKSIQGIFAIAWERLSDKSLEGSLARMFDGTQGAKRASGCTFMKL